MTTDTTSNHHTHTVEYGDTLTGLAQRYYGSAKDYLVIFHANRDKLDHPDRITCGQVLRIPTLQG